MEEIKNIHDMLVSQVEAYIEEGFDCVDTKELGEVIDMIKDLSETLYYHTVIEAMNAHPDKAQEMIEQKIL